MSDRKKTPEPPKEGDPKPKPAPGGGKPAWPGGISARYSIKPPS